jgi:hypothetical protein
MSLIWALMMLENTITEQYFEIVEVDKANKPAILSRLDYGYRQFSNTLSTYSDKNATTGSALPIYIDSETLDQNENHTPEEVVDLQEQGWTFL